MYSDESDPFIEEEQDKEKNYIQLTENIRKEIRSGFIVKVYGIIAYQIVITAIVIYLAFVSRKFLYLLLTSKILYYTNLFLIFFLILLPICAPQVYRIVPLNYIIITLFTFSYSCLIAIFVCFFPLKSIMVALFLTFLTVVSLSIYAWKSDRDFTIYGGTLFVSLILLLFSSFILIFLKIPFLNLLYTFISLIFFCIYLIYDTQLLIGEGEYKFSEDDYILAAMRIYLDIIIIFLKILQLIGRKD